MKRACILRQLGRCASTAPSSTPTPWSSTTAPTPKLWGPRSLRRELGFVADCGGVSCMSILLVVLFFYFLEKLNLQDTYGNISTENIHVLLSTQQQSTIMESLSPDSALGAPRPARQPPPSRTAPRRDAPPPTLRGGMHRHVQRSRSRGKLR